LARTRELVQIGQNLRTGANWPELENWCKLARTRELVQIGQNLRTGANWQELENWCKLANDVVVGLEIAWFTSHQHRQGDANYIECST